MSQSGLPVAKRKLTDSPPDGAVSNAVGQMPIHDLILRMSNLMDEKLEKLPTKQDFEEIKTNVNDLAVKIDTLQAENKALKEEVQQLKEERAKERKEFIYLEEHSKRNKIIFKNINYKMPLDEAVKDCCSEHLKLLSEICVVSTKKIYENDGKVGVIAEFQTEAMVRDIFQHAKHLAGTGIYLDRDLTREKQQDKRAMLAIKKQIKNISSKHRITILGDKMRINDKRFYWNRQKELLCGKQSGKEVLQNLYGDATASITINYNELLQNLNSKN